MPNVLAAAGQLVVDERDPQPDAPRLHAVEHSRDADVEGGLGERDVAAAAEHLAQVAAAVGAVVVLDRVGCLRRHPLDEALELAVQGDRAGVESDAGGQHLERRARHVALLVGVGEQRVAWRFEELLEGCTGGIEVGIDDPVRVVRRVAVHRHHGPGLDVEHHDRSVATAKRLAGRLLEVGAQRHVHVAGALTAREDVFDVADPLLRRLTREHGVL